MLHKIYTTDALILSSRPIKEANKFLKILTKDFGLVNATAQNVRGVNSKLRYALQDLSFLKVSLVNGREIWRVTNAVPDKNIFTTFTNKTPCVQVDTRCREVLINIVNLIRNLVHGEEIESKLFDIIYSAFIFLNSEVSFNLSTHALAEAEEKIKSVENIVVLKILNTLGYLSSIDKIKLFLGHDEYTENLLNLERKNRKKIVKTINKILKEI